MTATRRDFLNITAAVAVTGAVGAVGGCAKSEEEATTASTAADNSAPAVSEHTIAEAEKLAGVTYTDAERAQMVRTIGAQVQQVTSLGDTELENGLAPATVFNPLLPGTPVPPQVSGVTRSSRQAGKLPSAAEDIAFAPVSDLSEWVRTKQISSRELTGLYLSRLKSLGPKLESVVTLTEERALSQAARADREIAAGKYRGPLHGIPWGGKDLLDTKGIKTTYGAMPFRDRVPDDDAAVVKLLDAAGAVLVAKTTLGALAYGDIWFGGKTRNPWNLEEGSSGSSAGSASSTAAGLVGFALGTETLGSIVSPSTRCGTAGLRPTFGRVPRTGAMALCWSLDKIGALTRSVEDAALVLNTIAAHDGGDAGSADVPFGYDGKRPARGMKLGFDPAMFESEATGEIDKRTLEAARAIGAELVEIKLPEWPYSSMLPILLAEGAAAFEELTLKNLDDTMKWQEDRAWPNSFREARFIPAIHFVQAMRFRRRVMAMMAEKTAGLDAIISPPFGEGNPLLVITNYTGHPSLTIRAGFYQSKTRGLFDNTEDKATAVTHSVPHSTTLWGPLFGEDRLITLGMALEAELGVWDKRPPIA